MKKCLAVNLLILIFITSCQSPQPVARYTPSFNSQENANSAQGNKSDLKSSEKQSDANTQSQAAGRFKIGDAPDDLLRKAIAKWLGTPYRYGGMSPTGIDCSGFTTVIFDEVYGVHLPRRAKDQHLLGRDVDVSSLKQGDLVFFQLPKTRAVSHVGIYLSNGQFAHASTSSGVMISSLNEEYWTKLYKGARRLN